MSVTLKDIARMANVSISTVSRVINDDKAKPASKKTAEKVWAIAKEVGYVPNQHARNLIKGEGVAWERKKTKTIGCVYTSTKDSMSDPFFSYMGMGIKEQLTKDGYTLAFVMSIYDKSFEDMYQYLQKNPVDGIIVMGRFKQKTLDYLKENCDHIIYAGVNYVNAGFDEVICDSYKGASDMVDYLIKIGHSKIGYIGDGISHGEEDVVNEHRFEAYRDTLNKHGLPLVDDYIVKAKPYIQYAYDTMKAYLKGRNKNQLPSAFFCTNDMTAIGAMKAILEKGIKIPEDIAITGFDNVETSSFVNPPLTTIDVPKEELGRMAVRILIDKIEQGRQYPIRVDLPYALIIRDSCLAKK